MIDRFLSAFANFLGLLYSLTHSYGVAIILLTVIVMVVITPLNLKSTRSMLEMQRLQPQLRRIQAEFKDDRERQQQEMMAFYREHNISPLGGCLPMLAQGPVFFILYRVLRGITERNAGFGSGVGHVVGQLRAGVTPTAFRLTDQVFEPEHLTKTSELYRSLTHTNRMNFLGVDLAISPAEALRLGFITSIPFLILMVAMLVSQVIQNRQIQGRTPSADMPAQQRIIMKVLPFSLPVFSFGFPAGLGLYYLVQGICRIGLQSYITRRFYGEGGLGHQANEARKKAAEDAPAGKAGGLRAALGLADPTTSGAATNEVVETKSGSSSDSGSAARAAKSGPGKTNGANGNGAKSSGTRADKGKAASGKTAGAKSGGAKAPSTRSAAAQRNRAEATPVQRGRRSGTPRSGNRS